MKTFPKSLALSSTAPEKLLAGLLPESFKRLSLTRAAPVPASVRSDCQRTEASVSGCTGAWGKVVLEGLGLQRRQGRAERLPESLAGP